MATKNQPQLRLVIGGARSEEGNGYRSGRSSCRETPLSVSTASTRSAGTFPVLIQREILPCELNPSARANAVCPPTASQALAIGDGSSGSSDPKGSDLDMDIFNAQFVNLVNAYSANGLTHTGRMGREPESEPSEFWRRLAEAWDAKDLSTSQNGVAKKLGMTGNGSTGRWYRGDGLPETDTLIQIADIGGVTIDWLLTGNEPRTSAPPGSDLEKLLRIWEGLRPENRGYVLRAAENEQGRQQQPQGAEAPARRVPARRMGAG